MSQKDSQAMNNAESILERVRSVVSQVDGWLGARRLKIHVQPYTKAYYKHLQKGWRRSAKQIVPEILELIQPKHVIDVGCGVGIWLSVFKECGVENIWGVDGDYVDKKMLQIPEERFLSLDLKKPFRMDRQFDLVVSLEVAEHLPSECAETFVDSLTRLGPVILFSAAIPLQGGTHHINEQWPDYWAKYFQEKGYVVIDCIRKKIWQNDNVRWFYAQNILMFVRQGYLESHPLLKREFESSDTSQLSIVHPKALSNMSLRRALSMLPIVTKKALERRMKRALRRLLDFGQITRNVK